MNPSRPSGERLRILEERLRILEDRAAIADLISRYGPAVDSGDGEAAAALWTDDGEYVFDDTALDIEGIRGLTGLPSQRAYMAAGCAHVLSAPRIDLRADVATAVTHSVVLVHDGPAWTAVRVSANRWELVRTGDGWRIRSRMNRLLDGSAAARRLLVP